ncbi:zinc finger MYM-type protein 1-like [Olea europaea var. sylvestris]|uniref:zinc finger MYM-type protein 1-like n=1 Tax=Olea europaea var. sylvestris TaxID=158386 RepID=UPI000C1CCC64|nr:zinc finger MYM-type protein 1-like [Olea europaea var. sylvestris]
MEKYFKRTSAISCDEQNIDERNVRKKRDENDVRDVDVGGIGDVDVGDVGDIGDVGGIGEVGDVDVGFGGIGDVGNVEDIGDVGDSGGNVEDIGDVGNIGDVDVAQLPSDPGLRVPIQNYDINIRDVIRRAYMQRGPCQPRNHIFQPTRIGGFSNWKKKEYIRKHVGASSSAHNQARVKYELFKNQEQSIRSCLVKQSHQARTNYRIRLNASIDCVRFLLLQGMAFRGHDESEDSYNQENFLELLHWLCDHNPEIKAVALTNAPENLKLTSPRVQKDIVNAIVSECLHVIIENIRDSFFSILVDQSRDISVKEQMSVVIRYVKNGCILEHFIGVIHVLNTTAASLKAAIDQLFSTHNLSISNLRGHGYDGASNMRGEYNGLKALILKENPSAYYIHCFAHQLQLALVAVAQKHPKIETFFTTVHRLVNIVGGSAKRSDLIRENQRLKILESLSIGEISSERGLNQEITLQRPGDTRWGSHYSCLINLIIMFSTIVEVIEMIATDSISTGTRGDACISLELMLRFEFAFNLYLMKKILGISKELSKALQRKDQDIVNATKLVQICKTQFQTVRDDGWDSFLGVVCSFCETHKINVPDMDDMFVTVGRSRRETVTNLHHFRVEMFYAVIDMQLQELNDRFSIANSDLLICVACLSPNNSFAAFDKIKLIRLCQYYQVDFDAADILELDDQLDTYIIDIRTFEDFEELQGISDLAQKLVVKNKYEVYPLVYKLVTLTLVLLVATATAEKAFSAMTYVKNCVGTCPFFLQYYKTFLSCVSSWKQLDSSCNYVVFTTQLDSSCDNQIFLSFIINFHNLEDFSPAYHPGNLVIPMNFSILWALINKLAEQFL